MRSVQVMLPPPPPPPDPEPERAVGTAKEREPHERAPMLLTFQLTLIHEDCGDIHNRNAVWGREHQVERGPSKGKADIGDGEGEAIVGEEHQVVIVAATGATPTPGSRATPTPGSRATPTLSRSGTTCTAECNATPTREVQSDAAAVEQRGQWDALGDAKSF